jgi:MoxR-like ATPase
MSRELPKNWTKTQNIGDNDMTVSTVTEPALADDVASRDGATCCYQTAIDRLRQALNSTLIGKSDVVELVLACLLARGHLLFDDLPGLGKTTLAKAVAHSVGGEFARVQCTPDLLPSDITGFNVFNQKTREFEFREGPVFSDVLLADEINRATPRTQSALFEAMAERQVTIDRHTYRLSESFFVIATQNPVESHGAYPLPEAQLDRFAMKLRIGYPDAAGELEMLAANVGAGAVGRSPQIEPVIDPEQLRQLQQHVAQVPVGRLVQEYLVALARATREHREVTLGLSPRGLLTWQRVAQAHAHLQGRDFVIPDDVQYVARPVLEVRLAGNFDGAVQVVDEILAAVPVPVFGGRKTKAESRR